METGLGTKLAASGFGQATFARFCVATAELPPRKAVPAQRSLLRLFDLEALAGQIELVVRALLDPWISEKTGHEPRKALPDIPPDQVGAPRLHRPRWDTLVRTMAESL